MDVVRRLRLHGLDSSVGSQCPQWRYAGVRSGFQSLAGKEAFAAYDRYASGTRGLTELPAAAYTASWWVADASILMSFISFAQAQAGVATCILVAVDQRLLRAAHAEGLTTFNPEQNSAADVPAFLAGC